MSRLLRVAVPLVLAVAVFGVGVGVDGGDLSSEHWQWFLGTGLLCPGLLLGLAVYMVALGTYFIRDMRSRSLISARNTVYPEMPIFDNPAMGVPSALGVFVLAVVFVVGMIAVVYSGPHNQGDHIFPMSIWLLTAFAVGAFALLVLFGWARRRTTTGRMLLAIAAILVGVGVWQAGRWWEWLETARYKWHQVRATRGNLRTAEGNASRRFWAERMIAHRPDDWRGYAARYLTYNWRTEHPSATADVETALRLGCDDPRERESFGEYYSAIGQYGNAAREYDAAAAGFAVSSMTWLRDREKQCAAAAAFARLHAGDLDAACEWANVRRKEKSDDPEATHLLAMARIARGESAAARSLLQPTGGAEEYAFERIHLLAWVLATSPDPAVRNIPEARRLIAEYIQQLDTERIRFESNPPRFFRELKENTLSSRALSAQPVLAACSADAGEFADARQRLEEWKRQVGWDDRPPHSGFWANRYTKLDECVQAGKPYWDEPVK